MSDTPRTDALILRTGLGERAWKGNEWVESHRQIERELQAALMVQRSDIKDTGELVRYGIRWNGPREPIADPTLPGGYWTPWHIAQKRLQELDPDVLPVEAVVAYAARLDTDDLDIACEALDAVVKARRALAQRGESNG